MLRNLTFHTRFKPPENSDHIKFLHESLAQSLRTIKFNWNTLLKQQEEITSKEREKSELLKIFENYIDENQDKNKEAAM